MSSTYIVQGYVDIRIKVDHIFNASQSASEDDIAELVYIRVKSGIGSCEILNHLLQIKDLGK